MEYNRLGKAGIKVSELSLGTWLTFGGKLDFAKARECVKVAYETGVNFFDTAEVYANGVAESILGKIVKEYRREDLVISTKIFWGGEAPNQTGLSRKHLIEGTKNSLKRLKMDYVDLLYCHRPDPETPIEETVITMDNLIRQGLAFYWGTSEWSAKEIEAAHKFAQEYKLIPPNMEQPAYNMLDRQKVEKEYAPLYEKYGLGLTTFSPLASGILTGKYVDGIPKGSRLDQVKWLKNEFDKYELLTQETMDKVKKISAIAKELGATTAQLGTAWCLKNPHVSSVIVGASSVEQLKENLKAAEVKEKITSEILEKIRGIIS
ncbi:MAG: aldo/keto reductase [bacterium]